MYPTSAESRVTLGKAPERDRGAGRPLKRKTTWESEKARGPQVPAPRPPCHWCPQKTGAARPFKEPGSAPARRADPGTGGGAPRGPCSCALCPPGGAPDRPALVPRFVRRPRGARSRSPPLPHAGAPAPDRRAQLLPPSSSSGSAPPLAAAGGSRRPRAEDTAGPGPPLPPPLRLRWSPPGSMRCAEERGPRGGGARGRGAGGGARRALGARGPRARGAFTGGRPHGRLAARSAARAGPGWGFLSGAPGAPLRAPG